MAASEISNQLLLPAHNATVTNFAMYICIVTKTKFESLYRRLLAVDLLDTAPFPLSPYCTIFTLNLVLLHIQLQYPKKK